MPHRLLKSVPVWIVSLCAGSLLLAALTLGLVQATKTRSVSHPVTTIDYFSGAVHYTVPAIYNPGITRYSDERKYSALSFMLFLPNFSPAADHLEELKRPGWRDQMTLLFEHGPHMLDSDAQIAWMTNWPRGVHTRPEPAANGCDLYRTPLMAPGDVYVCPEDGFKLVLSCGRNSDVPFPSCSVFENVTPDLSLIYHYSAKYADDAVSIDRHIKALLSSFAKPETAAAMDSSP
ncbi:MAG: hypothetical protein ACRYGP_18035 [Janthinobacterium lividum]